MGSTVRPSMIFRSMLAPFWGHFCSQHRSKINSKINAIVDAILEAFWLQCLSPNQAVLEVILDSFHDPAESGAPHDNTVNSNEIEARALGKPTKKPPTNVETTVRTRRRTSDELLMRFWRHFDLSFNAKTCSTLGGNFG